MTLVFGCGHPHRGDDGAGVQVARQLAAKGDPRFVVHDINDDPLRMLPLWDGAPRAIVVDAAVTGAPPGTIHKFLTADTLMQNERFATSCHGISIKEAIELGRAIGQMPHELIVIAIEGKDFRRGSLMTAEVAQSVVDVVGLLLAGI